ncbi:MAG: hypothetical protein F082_777 [bacterium F082]|nr:MAG: hypothetical protein F082_777 [bacterium F082]KWW30698.1 MAG: hypothetical protein AUK64_590 [bacterium P201]
MTAALEAVPTPALALVLAHVVVDVLDPARVDAAHHVEMHVLNIVNKYKNRSKKNYLSVLNSFKTIITMIGRIIGLIISIALIIAGLSGSFVLKGTNSSMALVIFGAIFLVFDIIGIIRYNKNKNVE